MWWSRLLRAFDLFRKVWGLRTLLDLLGIWKWIVLGSAAVGGLLVSFWAYVSHLPGPEGFVLGLATCALLLLIGGCLLAFCRVWGTEPSAEHRKERPSAFAITCGCLLAVLTLIGWFLWARQTAKFVVLVTDLDYNSAQHFGLTKKIVERLRTATETDSDVEVRVLENQFHGRADRPAPAAREGREVRPL
jgi:hypothetical protein